MTILITDSVDQSCIDILKSEEYDVDYRPGILPEEIQKIIENADALIVRSGTNVTAEILASARKLKVVGRAGAGVDNIDVDAATRRGIIVMNTPGGNTVSTAEHTVTMMLALARNIPQAHRSIQEGKWERKKFIGTELYGKTLGIIGLGKVGMEVARRCSAFSMNVIAFDPLLSPENMAKSGVEPAGLDDIFRRSDFITVHSPLTKETKNLIGEKSLQKCKRGVRIINCARGGIVDEQALLFALTSGVVGGAALDVFETEPPHNSPLVNHPHVVVTPHLGASTEEAQEKVAIQIARQVVDALNGRGVAGSVNADIIQMAMKEELKPYVELAEKLGKLIAQIVHGKLKSIVISVNGEILTNSSQVLGAALLRGLLARMLFEPVNFLNAPILARERGITLYHRPADHDDLYANIFSVRYETDKEQRRFSGSVIGGKDVRIISIDGFRFEIKPAGILLFYSNMDKPGILAAVGSILAKANINIGGLSLGRYGPGQQALTVISLDNPVSEQILNEISSLDAVSDVQIASL